MSTTLTVSRWNVMAIHHHPAFNDWLKDKKIKNPQVEYNTDGNFALTFDTPAEAMLFKLTWL